MEKKIFDSRETVFQNGLKLITIKKDTQIASVNVGLKIGSLYEKKEEKGIAHFIEHMLFKGTSHRNNEVLNEELEQRGGEYNAYTEYTSTVFSITALSEELEKSIELLGDIVQNSIFPEEEIEKERGVILAEIRTSRDDVEDYSFKRANEFAFKKSPVRFDIIGEEKTVRSFKKKELVKFYKRYYVPNNCVVSIASPLEHEEAIALVEKQFNQWECKPVEREQVITEDHIPGKKITYKSDIEQSSIIYVLTFHNLTKIQELALKILNHKFGESNNSILFRELREERGLAYDVYSQLDVTNHVKTIHIYTAVSEENVEETLDVINGCIHRMKSEQIIFDDSTVMLMKKVLKTAVALTLEDSTDLAIYALHQSMDGESIYEFIEDMKNLDTIKSEDIYEIARKVMKDPSIHILLPEKSEEE